MEKWELQQMQSLPMEVKVMKTKARIREFYNHYEGDVYIAFSGGKDSTVLLDIARQEYPDIKACFINTGLEFPEIVEFVKTIKNVDIVKPEKSFRQVLDQYGYPVISKDVSQKLYYAKQGKQYALKHFDGSQKGSKFNCTKYAYMLDAPFKIHNKCCDELKKKPAHKYDKKNKVKPIIGTMAEDSLLRQQRYLEVGCNNFNNNKSTPMAFWLESDVWEYIQKYNIPYSKIYDMGYKRTGCVFCMFGVHLEKYPNRFQLLQKTHPKLWEYCIDNLGCGEVMDYIGVDYGREIRLCDGFEYAKKE